MSTLSKLERYLCRLFEVVEVAGKRERMVPILLTEQMKCGINTLISLRADMGVPHDNTYV